MHHNHPIATLTNGLRVANFSSPHPFNFIDGTVLPACSKELVDAGELDVDETSMLNPLLLDHPSKVRDISLCFHLKDRAREALRTLTADDNVDIILVPLPVLQCLRQELGGAHPKARCIRVADRHTKVIHIDRFCV